MSHNIHLLTLSSLHMNFGLNVLINYCTNETQINTNYHIHMRVASSGVIWPRMWPSSGIM